jgi:hypothetical protein
LYVKRRETGMKKRAEKGFNKLFVASAKVVDNRGEEEVKQTNQLTNKQCTWINGCYASWPI